MADDNQVALVKKGINVWNAWRKENPEVVIDLVGADLSGQTLSEVDLGGYNFTNANLQNANLSGAVLWYARFGGADLSDANLSHADLSHSVFNDYIFRKKNTAWDKFGNANLSGANLTETILHGADLKDVVISTNTKLSPKCRLIWEIVNQGVPRRSLMDVDLSGGNFTRVNLEGVDFRGANLCESIFFLTNLVNAKLSFANLKECSIKASNAEGASFFESNLKRALLSCSNFTRGDFRDANLFQAEFLKARLREADLSGASLRQAFLRGAKLRQAVLYEANLNKADLRETDLRSADLSYADLSSINLTKARIHKTICKYSIVDGSTLLDECIFDTNDYDSDFSGVGLDNARIDGKLKSDLKRNIRKHYWEKRYKRTPWLNIVKPFWCASDYGSSSTRIIFSFLVLTLIYTIVYLLPELPCWNYFVFPSPFINGLNSYTIGSTVISYDPHELFFRSLYFSVVTMTTLGFGDMSAHPASIIGQLLVMSQVILGYVLLGALITRLSILFQEVS